MKIKISILILITAILHYVGVAAYVFDLIPDDLHSIYFYNLDRIYIASLLIMLLIQFNKGVSLLESKRIKTALKGSVFQIIGYFIAVNTKFITNNYTELTWIIFFSFCFIISLTSFYYVSSRIKLS